MNTKAQRNNILKTKSIKSNQITHLLKVYDIAEKSRYCEGNNPKNYCFRFPSQTFLATYKQLNIK